MIYINIESQSERVKEVSLKKLHLQECMIATSIFIKWEYELFLLIFLMRERIKENSRTLGLDDDVFRQSLRLPSLSFAVYRYLNLQPWDDATKYWSETWEARWIGSKLCSREANSRARFLSKLFRLVWITHQLQLQLVWRMLRKSIWHDMFRQQLLPLLFL